MVDILSDAGRTKTASAYADLRRRLVEGVFAPFEELDEATLAARLPYGRTPIREALKRLTLEGFLVWPVRRPPRPAVFDGTAIHRLFETRLVLEENVARFAAQRVTPHQLEVVADLCEQIREAVERDQVYEATELDHAFHKAVARGSQNPFMVEAVDRLNCAALPLWFKTHNVFGIDASYDHHRNIVTTLTDRDPVATAAAVVDHVRLSYRRQLERAELTSGHPLPQVAGGSPLTMGTDFVP